MAYFIKKIHLSECILSFFVTKNLFMYKMDQNTDNIRNDFFFKKY
jgi:hypothetical protein